MPENSFILDVKDSYFEEKTIELEELNHQLPVLSELRVKSEKFKVKSLVLS
jgi:hypothetical protein